MLKKLSTLYPGWWLVLATGVIGFLGVGFTSLAFSVMFKPISAELGLNRTVTSIATSGQYIMGLALFSLGGAGSDKYGPRRMMLIGIVLASAGCFLMYFPSTEKHRSNLEQHPAIRRCRNEPTPKNQCYHRLSAPNPCAPHRSVRLATEERLP